MLSRFLASKLSHWYALALLLGALAALNFRPLCPRPLPAHAPDMAQSCTPCEQVQPDAGWSGADGGYLGCVPSLCEARDGGSLCCR